MNYLAVLDYEHLDNGMFLSALASSIGGHDYSGSVILHGESAYTERIIQTGVMREEAVIRSMKDLNHRLIALLADEGVSATGINGYRRSVIRLEEGELMLDRDFLDRIPEGPLLLFSSLALDTESGRPAAVPLPRMARFLREKLNPDEFFLFTRSEESEVFTDSLSTDPVSWPELSPADREELLPEEFLDFGDPVRLTTARDFQNLPDLGQTKPIL